MKIQYSMCSMPSDKSTVCTLFSANLPCLSWGYSCRHKRESRKGLLSDTSESTSPTFKFTGCTDHSSSHKHKALLFGQINRHTTFTSLAAHQVPTREFWQMSHYLILKVLSATNLYTTVFFKKKQNKKLNVFKHHLSLALLAKPLLPL